MNDTLLIEFIFKSHMKQEINAIELHHIKGYNNKSNQECNIPGFI